MKTWKGFSGECVQNITHTRTHIRTEITTETFRRQTCHSATFHFSTSLTNNRCAPPLTAQSTKRRHNQHADHLSFVIREFCQKAAASKYTPNIITAMYF